MIKVLACVTQQHDAWLVLLAALVCGPSTLATFFLYSRVPAFPVWRRWVWLTMTGAVAGSGIWTTHFVAMLAFKTGLETSYSELPTLGSLGVAILSCALGFGLGAPRQAKRSQARIMAGGLVVGLGITLMHYLGMSGFNTAGHLVWNPVYVLASLIIGGMCSSAALSIGRPHSRFGRQVIAAGLVSLGIVGMHFTSMTAVTILPDASMLASGSLLSDEAMVAAAVAVTVLILAVALGGVAFDSATRNGSLKRLREALDVLPEGLAFYDAADRLVAWNSQYRDLCAASGAVLRTGMTFDEILQSSLVHHAYPDARGRETEWLAERTAARWGDGASLTQRTSAGRWLRVTDRRTGDGGTVSVSVDITELKAAEQAIASARDKAEDLARRADAAEAVAGLGHWRLDAATRELTWSNQMYLIYGFEPGSVIDLEAVLARFHPEDAAAAAKRVDRQLVEGGTSENVVSRVLLEDGGVRYVVGRSEAERDSNGEITSVIGTIIDITAHKLAEIAVVASEERFRRLSVNAPDMITEFQLDGTMTYVSPASLAVTGFAPEDLIGRSFMTLMEPEDGDAVLAMCRTVFRSNGRVQPSSVEFRARHKDGRELWLECKPTPTMDPVTGRFKCFNDVVRDVTVRKALEAQLRQAQAQAEAAATVKADFLANMSHELRTPLTSIIGFTGLASEQPELSDLTRDYVDRVGNASRALLCTVNDILDFSKLEAGQVAIHPEPVSLNRLSQATLDLFMPQAGAKDLMLRLDAEGIADDCVVVVDPDRVRQILLNLVSNAVKFTTVGGVTLKTRYDRSARRLRVEVVDTGAGLTVDQQDRLFKRFSQIDGSLTRAQSGTGLGLAICKGLVEAMGGDIGVTSTTGHGSCFWFEIPTEPGSLLQNAEERPDVDHLSFTGIRVLVADDHPANRELARLYLSGVGVEITEAIDGEDAVRAAMELPYDVILMDVQMPILNGPGALRRIRAVPGPNDATPVLAFTAGAGPETRIQLLAEGFDDVVEKPVDPVALISAIARATAFVGQLDESNNVA